MYVYVYTFTYTCMCTAVCVPRSEDNYVQPVLSFCLFVDSRSQTQSFLHTEPSCRYLIQSFLSSYLFQERVSLCSSAGLKLTILLPQAPSAVFFSPSWLMIFTIFSCLMDHFFTPFADFLIGLFAFLLLRLLFFVFSFSLLFFK